MYHPHRIEPGQPQHASSIPRPHPLTLSILSQANDLRSEGESKDPASYTATMPIQGVLFVLYSFNRPWNWMLQPKLLGMLGSFSEENDKAFKTQPAPSKTTPLARAWLPPVRPRALRALRDKSCLK